MNKRLLISLTIITGSALAAPMAFADSSQACTKYYQQDKTSFLSSLSNDAKAIHNNIAECVQDNFCANSKDPGTCLKRIHLYDYYATVAANQQAQQKSSSSFGSSWNQSSDNNGSTALNNQASSTQQAQQKPKSSYDFTYKPPMPRPQDNSDYNNGYVTPTTNEQSGTPQKNIYQNIKF